MAGKAGAKSGKRVPVLGDRDYQDQADFRCALRKYLRFSEDEARSHEITPQQHLLLLVVRGHKNYPKVAVGDVSDSLQIRHHSASLLIDRCVKRGIVRRDEDPEDRRRALISLTDEGQRILAEITHANRRFIGSVRRDLFRDSLMHALAAYDAVAGNGDD